MCGKVTRLFHRDPSNELQSWQGCATAEIRQFVLAHVLVCKFPRPSPLKHTLLQETQGAADAGLEGEAGPATKPEKEASEPSYPFLAQSPDDLRLYTEQSGGLSPCCVCA